MSNLKAGFARVNINPPMGIFVSGYFKDRFADGILDDLEANALAINLGDTTQLMINVDVAGIEQKISAEYREIINKATSVPTDNIFISCTHTHTGPEVNNEKLPFVSEYREFLGKRLADVALFAVNDLKDAKMGYGVGKAENVAFVRRFIMKDGSTKTNPGVNNPDIVRPVGQIDDSVNVIRFDREGADTIVFVNFANHPDVVGGCKISGDWPALLRKNVEKILDNTKCIFFNGAQGDINHVNVHPKGGDLNGMFIDFDDVARGYSHAQYIARVVTGGVLQVFDKVNYIDIDSIEGKLVTINVPSNKPTPAELPEAHRINDLHLAGKDSELPYEGMMLTTVVAEAGRMVRLENAPDAFDMTLSGFRLGPIAFVGIPGEPFNAIGRGLKETEGYDLIIPCCITNGYQGYFPMQDSYDEGGYEARSSNFKAGVGEFIIKEGKKLLNELK
ncbi:MAG: hypothetical protein E7406_09350 [Ruminococcaceae bacterium]|nr:hypothetical protein [Oscillospiraceae bacterium]